jgi:MFS family permease
MNTESPSSGERLAAFQYRDYTLQWVGQLFSLIGTQMQLTAVDWHVYQLLQGATFTLHLFGLDVVIGVDKLGLGGLGLVRVVPIVLFALFGGIVADMLDRRQILIWAQVVAAFFAGLLAYLTLSGHETILAIYLISAAVAAVTAFSNPARQSLIANLVPRKHLSNAMSLNNVMWQVATISGPALTGPILSLSGPGVVYLLNAVSFGAMLVALLMMHYRGTANISGATLSRASLVEGIRFTFDHRVIRSTMLLDFLATFFASARTMLPVVANEMLHSGVNGFAILSTAQSVGAVIAAVALSLRRDIRRQGVVLLISVGIYGLATTLFGFSSWFAGSYLLLALTGAGDTVSTVIRSTLRQLITPDHLRGRMTGVNMIFFSGGPQLGEMEAGLVAALWGVPLAIITGGLVTVILTLVIAWQYPSLRAYMGEVAEPVHA